MKNRRKSLSARRAWIEITVLTTIITICTVALRKESVDRNAIMLYNTSSLMQSLSARRAWIEIKVAAHGKTMPSVALRKESVDRNLGGVELG